MFTKEHLDIAFETGKEILFGSLKLNGIDTLNFRKGFEHDFDFTKEEKSQVIEYLEDKIKKEDEIFALTKKSIDSSEMSSDHFRKYPKKFQGSTYPVVIKTFAGLISLKLEELKGQNI